jgi:hypothetical protein
LRNLKYLKLRKQSWTVRYPVPMKDRKIFGQSEVNRTLGTRSLEEAKQKKYPVIAAIQNEIAEAVRKHSLGPQSIEWLKSCMMVELEAFHAGRIDQDTLTLHQGELMDMHLKANSVDEGPNAAEAHASGWTPSPIDDKRLREAHAVVNKTSPGVLLLSSAVSAYLEGLEGVLIPDVPPDTRRRPKATLCLPISRGGESD